MGWLGKVDVLDHLQKGPYKRVSIVRIYTWLWRSEGQVSKYCLQLNLLIVFTNLLSVAILCCHGTTYLSQT
jgi:hypothetical protein